MKEPRILLEEATKAGAELSVHLDQNRHSDYLSAAENYYGQACAVAPPA
jgi:hypothetical protein